MEEERRKSLLHLQLSHPTALELMLQVNMGSHWSRRIPESKKVRKRKRGEGEYGFLLLSTFLAAWEAG